MATVEVLKSSRVVPTEECPECSRVGVERSCKPVGGSLFALYERCRICGWSKSFAFVKMGA